IREFSILVFPYAKLRRCSSLSCDVETFFLASSRSSCRRLVTIHPSDMKHLTTGSAEENPVSVESGTRVLPAHSILAQGRYCGLEPKGEQRRGIRRSEGPDAPLATVYCRVAAINRASGLRSPWSAAIRDL